MAGYIFFDAIPGESTDTEHKNWINLLSVSEGISRMVQRGKSGSSRNIQSAIFDDLVCVKELDKSSPKIIESVASGKVHPVVKLDLCQSLGDKGKRLPYFQFELKNVIVTSYSFSASVDDDGTVPTESFGMNFEEGKWTYNQYGKDGSNQGKVEATWKVEEGST
ncbi:type VI secretion system tube protein Hcp [Bremerella sp. JC770]|uniref:Hcp family type VI secretion system effector n=1 Tax=Bremerella sp. JC770 TaxID=3232137 RepID=UPI0034588DFC